MKSLTVKILSVLLVTLLISEFAGAQNTAITDDQNYNAHSSAMLDVYSESKGLLIPRVTNAQMSAIVNPADGLLIYNLDRANYYFYVGTSWFPVSGGQLFQNIGDTIFYLTGENTKMGIGTPEPMSRLTVQGSALNPDAPLFDVKNSEGDVIFAVYENEVKVNFKEDAGKAIKGGFAVGGLTSGKAEPTEYMRITPDSVRIYINDTAAKGIKGGFAVGGLTSGKASPNKYFILNQDSTRIYHNAQAKAIKGGFAVGGLTSGKAAPENYLTVERDSTRIYVNQSTKGIKGGFAVGGLTSGKNVDQFLSLTPENYFIGHNAGNSITSGHKNSVVGYQSGTSLSEGSYNVFLGYQAGLNTTLADNNVFIGNNSGKNTLGDGSFEGINNVFIGRNSGLNNKMGQSNVYIGESVSKSDTSGRYNVNIGKSAAINIEDAHFNVLIGAQAAEYKTTGSHNVFIGDRVGTYNEGGKDNVMIGTGAGGSSSITGETGTADLSQNVIIGTWAAIRGLNDGNVVIGYSAGRNLTNHVSEGNILIGRNAGYNETGSNKLYLENSSSSTPLIYGDFSSDEIEINGSFQVDNEFYDSGHDPGTSGQILSSTSSGTNWIDMPNITSSTGSANHLAYWNSSSTISHDNAQLYWDAANNRLGIGTSNPGNALQVIGNIETSGNLLLGNDIQVADDNYIGIGASSERIEFDASGEINILGAEVGIGMTTPSVSLHVKSNASDEGIQIDEYSGTEDWSLGVNSAGNLVFYDDNTERIVFEDYGNVGIGLTNPYYTLDVEDAIGIANKEAVSYNISDDYFRWGNGATKNYFPDEVGIGTTDPGSHKLYVESSSSSANSATCKFENTNNDGLALVVESSNYGSYSDAPLLVSKRGTSGNIVSFDCWHGSSSGWDREFSFEYDGDAYADGAWNSKGADYAEFFPKADIQKQYEPGDIILMSDKGLSVETSSEKYSNKIIGVYSNNPAIVGNSSPETNKEHMVLVGLMGVVDTKVSVENGEINVGDFITTSSVPGVGMKASESGMCVGRAMQPFRQSGTGLIKVLINAQWVGLNH